MPHERHRGSSAIDFCLHQPTLFNDIWPKMTWRSASAAFHHPNSTEPLLHRHRSHPMFGRVHKRQTGISTYCASSTCVFCIGSLHAWQRRELARTVQYLIEISHIAYLLWRRVIIKITTPISKWLLLHSDILYLQPCLCRDISHGMRLTSW